MQFLFFCLKSLKTSTNHKKRLFTEKVSVVSIWVNDISSKFPIFRMLVKHGK